ncbi:hypothetical protein L228DRAFT_201510, partial [Xylona heveae TC161]
MAAPARKFSNIRRSRPSYSCENCRARRVKCDQIHPKCTNCSRNQVDCVYADTNLKRKSPSGDKEDECSVKAVRRKVEDDNAGSNQGYLLLQNGGRSRYIENTFWACVDVKGLELESLLFDLPLFPLEDICCTAGQGSHDNTSLHPCQHYIGTTEPNFSFWASRRPTGLRSNAPSLSSMLSALPPRETCDFFYENFLECVHPLIPLIHITTFDSRYRQFWDWHKNWKVGDAPDGILLENPSFLPLLLTVLFTGSVARSKIDVGLNMCPPLETQKRLYQMIPLALAMVGFPHSPAIYSLMAFILLNSMLIREEESLSSCSFVAVAFRISQAMGLHKDGTDFGLDDIQTEERRRVWYHLLHLDVMTSIVSGLPLVASSEMFSNTRMIGELRDEYIGKVQLTKEVDCSPIIDSNYILTAGRYDSTSCIRSILLRQFSPSPLGLSAVKNMEQTIEELQTRMEERIKRLNSQSREERTSASSSRSNSAPPTASDNGDAHVLNLWGRSLLKLMVEKAYCLLYQPTMRDSNLWMELRAKAIPRFQSFLSIFIDMSSTESYLPFQWLYPGAYQPLQPVAVLLIDLFHNPHSTEAQKSRRLLERTFSLLGPEGRITNGTSHVACWPEQRHASAGAKQAWMRLERLRSRVWQKLGLDSSVLW